MSIILTTRALIWCRRISLVSDRSALAAPAAHASFRPFGFFRIRPAGQVGTDLVFQRVAAAKMRVSLPARSDGRKDFVNALRAGLTIYPGNCNRLSHRADTRTR